MALVDKTISLVFNILSRLVTAFLPRSKCLLISWMQSPSAVIFSSFSSVTQSFLKLRPQESQNTRPPCQSPTPGVHKNSFASGWRCHPAISSSVLSLSSCPQSLPASGSFQESALHIRWPSIAVSASVSVLPLNIQD